MQAGFHPSFVHQPTVQEVFSIPDFAGVSEEGREPLHAGELSAVHAEENERTSVFTNTLEVHEIGLIIRQLDHAVSGGTRDHHFLRDVVDDHRKDGQTASNAANGRSRARDSCWAAELAFPLCLGRWVGKDVSDPAFSWILHQERFELVGTVGGVANEDGSEGLRIVRQEGVVEAYTPSADFFGDHHCAAVVTAQFFADGDLGTSVHAERVLLSVGGNFSKRILHSGIVEVEVGLEERRNGGVHVGFLYALHFSPSF